MLNTQVPVFTHHRSIAEPDYSARPPDCTSPLLAEGDSFNQIHHGALPPPAITVFTYWTPQREAHAAAHHVRRFFTRQLAV